MGQKELRKKFEEDTLNNFVEYMNEWAAKNNIQSLELLADPNAYDDQCYYTYIDTNLDSHRTLINGVEGYQTNYSFSLKDFSQEDLELIVNNFHKCKFNFKFTLVTQ